MKIFTNKQIKHLFLEALLCLFLFVLAGTFLALFDVPHKAAFIFAAALAAFGAVFAAMCAYFCRQNHMIENAEEQIDEYISGNRSARIECSEDGELYKLFHRINSLVSILNAHGEKETRSKEFLKNTISDISHQLKTPLAALNIYNGILQDEAKELPDIRKFADLTEQELDRIGTLVQSLLKITKLDAGTIRIEKKEENLSEMMREIKNRFLFRADREEKQINLMGDDTIMLSCDRGWLIQAIENIVKNALDHTDKGGCIDIEQKRFRSVVRVVIRDNGRGIHPEDIHHIFKRFYRSRFSKDTQGIGLGLPLAKAIIEAHNGSIEVDSRVGVGTTFIINFLTER